MGVALEGNRAHKAGSHGGAFGRKRQRDAGPSFCLAGTCAPQLWKRHPDSPLRMTNLGLGDSVGAEQSPRSGGEQMTQASPFRATPLTTPPWEICWC